VKARKPTRHPWPAHLGPNTPQDRARTIGRAYRAWATKWAHLLPPEAARELAAADRLAAAVGEAVWLMPTAATHVEGQRLTREQVAHIASVDTPAVVMWARRGIRRDGDLELLERNDDGLVVLEPGEDGRYDYYQVDEFLKLRDAAATRKVSRSCSTPALRPPRPATAGARPADTSRTVTPGRD
jgi:hypothetical protein